MIHSRHDIVFDAHFQAYIRVVRISCGLQANRPVMLTLPRMPTIRRNVVVKYSAFHFYLFIISCALINDITD